MKVRDTIATAWTVLHAKLHPHQHKDCERPWVQTLWALIPTSLLTSQKWIMAERTQPCRTGCEPCMRRYASSWAYRIAEEIERADRARFETLKFRDYVNSVQAYSALRSYERLLRDKAKRHAQATGQPETKLRRVAVIERGEKGTKRLHLHVIYCEHGPPLPRRFYKDRSYQHPQGCWLHGWCKTNVIRNTPLKAARYLTKYLMKDPERFPGGRRLAASPFWGPGQPRHRAAKPWTDKQRQRFHASLAADQAADAAKAAAQPGSLPSCALLSEPPTSSEKCTEANRPTGPPNDWIDSIICGWGDNCTVTRLVPPSEIPPKIAKLWFANEPA